MIIPAKGHSIFLGSPNYYGSEDETPFAEGLPDNCANPPANGARCFMLTFPFIGTERYGCASQTAKGGYGAPYVECEPVILKGGGFLDFTPFIRIGITLGIVLLGFSLLGGKK